MSNLRAKHSSGSRVGKPSGRRRAKMLAVLALTVIVVFLFGRSLITEVRPHVDEEQDVARQQLEEDIASAIHFIDDKLKMAISARIGGENDTLSVWVAPEESSAELLAETRLERVDFYVDEDKNLVANPGIEDTPHVLVKRVENIVFHLLDPGGVGLVLAAERGGELVEARHLSALGEEVSE